MKLYQSIFKISIIISFVLFGHACTNFNIQIPEIAKVKNIEHFQNKIDLQQDDKSLNKSPKDKKENTEIQNDNIQQQWWKKIKSNLLQQKIDNLLANNIELKAIVSKIKQVNLKQKIENNVNYPKIDLDITSSRSKLSSDSYSNSNGYELSSYWEAQILDHHHKKAQVISKATQEEKNLLTQILIANLIKLYINVTHNQKQLNLAQKYLKNSQDIYEISKKRYEFGILGSNLKNTLNLEKIVNQNQQNVENIKKNIKNYSYEIDSMLGQKIGSNNYKQEYTLPKSFSIITPKPDDIVTNRPDIKILKTKIEAAGEAVSIAISDLYPNLSFGTSNILSEESFKDFFDVNKLASSIFANISFKILARGDIKNNIEIKKNEYKEISYKYAHKILESFLEVEKSLMLHNFYNNNEKKAHQNLELANKEQEIYKNKYNTGVAGAIEYITTKQKTIQTQQKLLTIENLKWHNYISLNLAIGK